MGKKWKKKMKKEKMSRCTWVAGKKKGSGGGGNILREHKRREELNGKKNVFWEL